MKFDSAGFLVFIVLAALLYWRVPSRWRGWFLAAASYAFYCTWNARMAGVMAAITVVCFLGGIAIERFSSQKRKSQLAIGLTIALVAYIVFFKSRPLFAAPQNAIIPLGVSYYTFKLLSYIIDVYWGKISAERNLGRFAAFVAFFPQIVAGPIQRANTFFEQMERSKAPDVKTATLASLRILMGLFKKMFVAGYLGAAVDPGFSAPLQVDGLSRILAFYLFPLQLYADFSALTDISNGTAQFFGLEGVENFDAPFAASSISEYWRRWHMSLTGWLRDYVFMPLRMSFRNLGIVGLVLSVCVNMMLVALWHGFSYAFVAFGALHSFFLSLDALSLQHRKRLFKRSAGASRVGAILGTVITYNIVAAGNVFFRAPMVSDGLHLILNLGRGLSSHPVIDFRNLYLGLIGFALIEALDYTRRHGWQSASLLQWPRGFRWLAYFGVAVLYLFAIVFILARSAPHLPFVYAGF